MAADQGPIIADTATVIEAVTPLLPVESGDLGLAVSFAFDRCVERINDLHRAYILVTDDIRVRPFTREVMYPRVPYLTRHPRSSSWGGTGFFAINFALAITPQMPDLTLDQHEYLARAVAAIGRGDPRIRFREWEHRARHALEIEGDRAGSIIASYAAIETLFDPLLQLMAWEEGNLSPDKVLAWFERENLAKRLRKYYGGRLGGNWDTTDPRTPLGPWHAQVAKVRHLVIHAGHRPTSQEARAVFSAMQGSVDFTKDRLVENRNKYPRTTLILLGKPVLERRGLFNGKIKRFFENEAAVEDPRVSNFNEWRRKVVTS